MAKERQFTAEADLVAAYCASIDPAKWVHNQAHAPRWIAYHETAEWDLLLVHKDTGEQIGIEAKLTLNAKVLEQALPDPHWSHREGPDYRAVLVPVEGVQAHLERIAHHLGIVVIKMWKHGPQPNLPDRSWSTQWPHWCPMQRCRLPEYVPDVTGGHAAPVKLSEWKIKAIKLLILLERRGAVTRRDMKILNISPSRWTDAYHGFLTPAGDGGYVRNSRTPDLKAQHPTVWDQIEADFEKWAPPALPKQTQFAA